MKNYKLLSLIALIAAFSCSPNNEDVVLVVLKWNKLE